MNIRDKQGFTLIELLAVIVILALIALIATPIIIGLIDDARKESFKASSYGMISSGEHGFSKTLLNQEGAILTEYKYNNGEETRVQGNIELAYNGVKPQNGTMIISPDGKVSLAIHNGKYCVVKGFEDSVVTLSDKTVAECLIVDDVVALSKIYSSEIVDCIVSNRCTGVTLPTGFTDLDKGTWIPVASKTELKQIQATGTNTFGAGTVYEGQYTGGLDKKYLLVKNIDLNNENFEPIGLQAGEFTGKLDGEGFKVFNGHIDSSATNVGLFTSAYGATIKNVGVEFSNINLNALSNNVTFGGLIGYATSQTIINNSYVKTNSITTTEKIPPNYPVYTINIGGIVGAFNGKISDVYFEGGSFTLPLGTVTNGGQKGGLVATIGGSENEITRSYAVGENIEGTYYLGGLLGGPLGYGTLSNSFSLFDKITDKRTSGSSIVGRVIGTVGGITLSNNYANASMISDPEGLFGAGTQNNKDGQDITLAVAKQKSTYTNLGWNFDNIWKIDEGISYPRFIWEN